jgi:glycosyltransferase involved in cell wall biosynthesis
MLEAPRFQGEVNHVTGDVHYLALLLRGRRTVLTIHDLIRYHSLDGWRQRFYRWIARRARLVTAPSAATRDDLIAVARCPADKVRVVPTPLSPGFTHDPKPFPEGQPTILAVGSAPNKNLDRLIAALEGLDCRLVVVGELSADQVTRLRRCGIDHREFTGLTREQVVERYRESDLVAFVSTSEGFGLPVVEAQAVGRPVVTGDRASLPEVAGSAACLVDPFDVADIRRGLLRVMGDGQYRNRLVAAGLDNARRFDAAVVAAAFRAIYEEIAR